MVKNSTILTISITKEQEEFINRINRSPSEIIQKGINEEMDLYKRYHTEIGELNSNIDRLLKFQQELLQFLEEIGKSDEFRRWRGEQYV